MVVHFLYLQVFITFSAILSLACADHAPAPAYKAPTTYEDTPASYKYGYDVKDDYTGVAFGADEGRDGYATSGKYQVLLPDGRTQIVTYTVDGYR